MNYKIQPWAHQQKAIEEARHRNEYALFFEQGAGKSLTIINILRQKYIDAGCLLPTLILCPPIVVENWRREILANSEIHEMDIVTLTGSGISRIHKFENKVERISNGHKIVITNFEALLMKHLSERLKIWAPKALVVDESHKCKDLAAKRTRQVVELSKTAEFRYILSGTPIVNSAMDIFSQFMILDGGDTFGVNYRAFREEYFVDRNANRPRHCYFPDWQLKSGALKQISEKVYKKAVRVLKSDALDLPPLVKQTVEFELKDDQAKAYQSLETNSVADVSGAVVSADLAIKKALRLQQIASGFVPDDNGKVQSFEKNERIKALEEVLDSIGKTHKIIIWAVFKQNYEDIRRLLAKKKEYYVEVHGEISANQKQANIDAFSGTTSPARILIGHPASGGIGCNLTSASYSIFYSRGFSLENDLQAEARNYRGGSERHSKITRIDIIAKNTIDEVVANALLQKLDISDQILTYMKGRT